MDMGDLMGWAALLPSLSPGLQGALVAHAWTCRGVPEMPLPRRFFNATMGGASRVAATCLATRGRSDPLREAAAEEVAAGSMVGGSPFCGFGMPFCQPFCQRKQVHG